MEATWIALGFAAFLQACVLSALLVPVARAMAPALGLMDRPGIPRKLHSTPIPRAGGIAIYLAFWGCVLGNLALARFVVPSLDFLPDAVRVLAANTGGKLGQVLALFAGATTIFLLGIADDRYDLPPMTRLVVQVLACLPLVYAGIALKLFLPGPLAALATVAWLVLLTNSFNFLDNMNGLASGVSATICLAMAILAVLSREWYMLLLFALLAGAAIGFWFYNFPRASIFLGDGGSTHLGFTIGALAILVTYYQEGVPTRLPVLMPLIVLGVPIFDTVSVMWIRWRAGKPFMQGDTNHVSHRLVALGFTRTQAVVFLYVATLATGLAAIPLRQLDTVHGVIQAIVLALIFLLLHWLERASWQKASAPPANNP